MGLKQFRFHLPDRQPGEEDATERQKGYIKSLVDSFDDAEIEKLGIWQASNLIDQIKEFKEEHGYTSTKKKPKEVGGGGCFSTAFGMILLVVVIFLVVLWLYNKFFS